jgi:hypothetical protein
MRYNLAIEESVGDDGRRIDGSVNGAFPACDPARLEPQPSDYPYTTIAGLGP